MPYTRTVQLHYTIHGTGEPLVLVHGYLSDSTYWRTIVPELSKHYQVIAIDLLGFGKSPKPASADYSLDEHVTALAETIKQVTNKPIILVGHSMGSLVSARFAAQYPDAVARLLLCNMPLFPDAVQAREVIKRTNPTYRLMLYSPFARILWPIVRCVWPAIRPLLRARRLVPGPPGAFSSHHTYASRMGSLKNTVEVANAMQLLQKLTQPTTLILGIFDRRVYKRTLDTTRLPSNISIDWVDTGHHTVHQLPSAVLDILIPPSRKS